MDAPVQRGPQRRVRIFVEVRQLAFESTQQQAQRVADELQAIVARRDPRLLTQDVLFESLRSAPPAATPTTQKQIFAPNSTFFLPAPTSAPQTPPLAATTPQAKQTSGQPSSQKSWSPVVVAGAVLAVMVLLCRITCWAWRSGNLRRCTVSLVQNSRISRFKAWPDAMDPTHDLEHDKFLVHADKINVSVQHDGSSSPLTVLVDDFLGLLPQVQLDGEAAAVSQDFCREWSGGYEDAAPILQKTITFAEDTSMPPLLQLLHSAPEVVSPWGMSPRRPSPELALAKDCLTHRVPARLTPPTPPSGSRDITPALECDSCGNSHRVLETPTWQSCEKPVRRQLCVKPQRGLLSLRLKQMQQNLSILCEPVASDDLGGHSCEASTQTLPAAPSIPISCADDCLDCVPLVECENTSHPQRMLKFPTWQVCTKIARKPLCVKPQREPLGLRLKHMQHHLSMHCEAENKFGTDSNGLFLQTCAVAGGRSCEVLDIQTVAAPANILTCPEDDCLDCTHSVDSERRGNSKQMSGSPTQQACMKLARKLSCVKPQRKPLSLRLKQMQQNLSIRCEAIENHDIDHSGFLHHRCPDIGDLSRAVSYTQIMLASPSLQTSFADDTQDLKTSLECNTLGKSPRIIESATRQACAKLTRTPLCVKPQREPLSLRLKQMQRNLSIHCEPAHNHDIDHALFSDEVSDGMDSVNCEAASAGKFASFADDHCDVSVKLEQIPFCLRARRELFRLRLKQTQPQPSKSSTTVGIKDNDQTYLSRGHYCKFCTPHREALVAQVLPANRFPAASCPDDSHDYARAVARDCCDTSQRMLVTTWQPCAKPARKSYCVKPRRDCLISRLKQMQQNLSIHCEAGHHLGIDHNCCLLENCDELADLRRAVPCTQILPASLCEAPCTDGRAKLEQISFIVKASRSLFRLQLQQMQPYVSFDCEAVNNKGTYNTILRGSRGELGGFLREAPHQHVMPASGFPAASFADHSHDLTLFVECDDLPRSRLDERNVAGGAQQAYSSGTTSAASSVQPFSQRIRVPKRGSRSDVRSPTSRRRDRLWWAAQGWRTIGSDVRTAISPSPPPPLSPGAANLESPRQRLARTCQSSMIQSRGTLD